MKNLALFTGASLIIGISILSKQNITLRDRIGALSNSKVSVRTITKTIKEPRMTLEQALTSIPRKYGVSDDVVHVLLDKESSGRMEAIRFEPSKMKAASRITKEDGQQRMLASSHCAMQVLGLTAHSLGVSWKDLYDPETCVETGTAYLAKQKEACRKHGNRYDILACASMRYNGSGPKARAYSQDFMTRLARKVINRETNSGGK